MAPPAAISSTLVVLLVAFTASGVGAANFTITNMFPCMLFPATVPFAGGREGGMQLKTGDTWTFMVAAGASGRIWSRIGCSFDPTTSLGGCNIGDCCVSLPCILAGETPATLAEFTLGNGGGEPDSYGISVVEGFNIPMDFSCSTRGNTDVVIRCMDPGCPDANHRPGDHKHRTSQGDSDYEVVFCPST